MLRRFYADSSKPRLSTKENVAKSDLAILPGSETNIAESKSSSSAPPVTPKSPATILPQNGSRMSSPPSPANKAQTTLSTSSPTPSPNPQPSPPPPPQPPKPARSPRRFRRLLIALALLTGLGYAGGVYYSLVSDNFHDFFTEYVPFGEDAVLYLEDREFRRRFPNATARIIGTSRETGNKVTIPSGSGVTWKVADETGSQQKGRHTSALRDDAQPIETKDPERSTIKSGSQKVENVKSRPLVGNQSSPENDTNSETAKEKAVAQDLAKRDVRNGQELKPATVKAIDPLEIKDAEEQVVRDLVKVINDIIAVLNSDNAGAKYSSAMEFAKAELTQIGGKIVEMRDSEKESAERKIKELHKEFDKAAKELVRRLEEEMRDQEARWRDEFESERETLSHSYQSKLQRELERSKEVSEKRLHNELLEQAIEMKRKFTEDIKDRVEQERGGRLGKLSELSAGVSELEQLTSGWNEVVDSNLKTQHLHVAVETIRSSLEKADRPRPFVRELAALKEIAEDDPVVNAAIASISPVAYQRGVATPAQLVDRFRYVADEVRKASLLPEDAGIVSHAASLLLSKFLFKKKGLVTGNDVESILSRTETLLEEGDLDSAAREMNELTGWAKTLSRDWLAEIRRVLEVQQALDVIATEARLQSLRVE
ncbi:MAG: Formation of crista junctions protein 1 [Geoglossum simile]|nr:MAG: Formation of crista junctions protein 1 [Geoglossum simile]